MEFIPRRALQIDRLGGGRHRVHDGDQEARWREEPDAHAVQSISGPDPPPIVTASPRAARRTPG